VGRLTAAIRLHRGAAQAAVRPGASAVDVAEWVDQLRNATLCEDSALFSQPLLHSNSAAGAERSSVATVALLTLPSAAHGPVLAALQTTVPQMEMAHTPARHRHRV